MRAEFKPVKGQFLHDYDVVTGRCTLCDREQAQEETHFFDYFCHERPERKAYLDSLDEAF